MTIMLPAVASKPLPAFDFFLEVNIVETKKRLPSRWGSLSLVRWIGYVEAGGGGSAGSIGGILLNQSNCRTADVTPATATPMINGEAEHTASRMRKTASAR